MDSALIIQKPEQTAGTVQQLFLLFHGVGATPDDLLPVGHHLAAQFPNGWVVSVPAPHPSDFGQGLQWFSVSGVTEENRAQRIAQALPVFIRTVQDWQAKTGVDATATALFGFSQGAIMSLEAAQHAPLLASRIIAHSGRFAQLPKAMPDKLTVHLVHGKNDAVIPYQHAVTAAHHLKALGADFTADVLPYLGHEISDESLALMTSYLTGHVPKHLWAAALEAGVPKV